MDERFADARQLPPLTVVAMQALYPPILSPMAKAPNTAIAENPMMRATDMRWRLVI
jgi:hypothetical protein